MRRRAVSELPAASPERIPVGSRILLDTCVYIDGAAGRLPEEVGALIKRRIQHHSSVCLAELAQALGELDPRDARTPQRRKAVESIIARVTDDDRTVSPDEHGWAMAGLLAGMLRRLQGFGEEQRRKAMADSLIFVTALRNGLTLLTANVAEFDLLQQLLPETRVAFYRPL